MTAEEFRRLRLAVGLSLNGVARALGVARSTICRWENGGRRIPSAAADTLRGIAKESVMKYTAVVREDPNSGEYNVHYHESQLPAFDVRGPFETAEEAKASEPELAWQEPEDDADANVVAVAHYD